LKELLIEDFKKIECKEGHPNELIILFVSILNTTLIDIKKDINFIMEGIFFL
jgi:hypothetical protein